MKIEFKTIRWKNLFSYPNNWNEIPLNSHQATLIRGRNGAGKSTFLDALTFVLFNRAFREDVNKGELVNDLTNRECAVEVKFDVGGKEYKIIRGIKPDIFEVRCNNELINRNTNSRDYQEILEKQILRCNFKSFCQVVILGSDTYIPFMKLSVPKRREIIEGLLDLDVFSAMTSILKTKITDLGNTMKDRICDREKVEQRISLLEMSREELRKNNDGVIADYEKNKAELKQTIRESESRILTLNEVVSDNMINVGGDLDDKIQTLDAMRIKCKTQMDTIESEIEFFAKHDTCPTCRQKINDAFRNEMICKKTTRFESLDAIYTPALNKVARLRGEKKVMEVAQAEMASHRSEIKRETDRIYDMRHQIATIESYIRRLIEKNKKFDDTELDRLHAETITISKEIQGLADDLAHHRAALTILPLIKAQIISKFIPIFNEQISFYLNKLESNLRFEINETFEEKVTIRGRHDKGYGSLSAGEKYRVDLSLLFAWRAVARLRNSVNCSLLCFDEVLDASLDTYGKEQLMDVLKNIHHDTNIFVISHSEDLFDQAFDRVVEVFKRGNFSQMRIS